PPLTTGADAAAGRAYPPLPVRDGSRGRARSLLGTARDLEPDRSGVYWPALGIIRWLLRSQTGGEANAFHIGFLSSRMLSRCFWPVLERFPIACTTNTHSGRTILWHPEVSAS